MDGYEATLRVVMREDLEDGGYVVKCPALPGCVSQGETVEEALANIKEAMVGVIRARVAAGQPLPEQEVEGDQLTEIQAPIHVAITGAAPEDRRQGV